MADTANSGTANSDAAAHGNPGAKPAGVIVAQLSQLRPAYALRVIIDDYPVAVVMDSAGEVHAIGDTCTHADVSLADGEEIEGCEIECWGHGSRFDLNTGAPQNLPAFEPVPVFALEIDGDDIWVDTNTVLNGAPKNII